MFILEHNCGESHFETINDAVTALLMADHFSDEPEQIGADEANRIKAIVSRGGRYSCANCELWATSDELPF